MHINNTEMQQPQNEYQEEVIRSMADYAATLQLPEKILAFSQLGSVGGVVANYMLDHLASNDMNKKISVNDPETP